MNKLAEYIQKYKQENLTGWRRWLFGALAVLAVVALAIGYSIQATLRAREIARLKHELDTANNHADSALADAAVASHEEAKDQAVARAEFAQERAEEIKAQVEALETTHKQSADVINSIRSWEDVDAKVR